MLYSTSRLLLTLGFAIAAPISTTLAQQGAEDDGRNIRYFNRQWDFDGVDIGKLTGRLARVGLSIPVELEGEIVGSLSVGVPWGALRDAQAWRFGGKLSSDRLTVNGLRLEQVVADIRYREGALRLEQLRVAVAPPGTAADSPRGQIAGKASLQLLPRGDATAELQVRDLPLAALSTVSEAVPAISGRLSSTLSAKGQVDQLSVLRAWTLSGPAKVADFAFRQLPASDAAVQLRLHDGVLSATQLQATMGGATLTGDAELSLLGEQTWTVDARVDVRQLASTVKAFDGLLDRYDLEQLSQRIQSGRFDGSAKLEGALRPWRAEINGRGRFAELLLQLPPDLENWAPLKHLNLRQLDFAFAVDDQVVRLSQIRGRLAGGEIAGELVMPLYDGLFQAEASWHGVQLAELLTQPLGGSGVSDGQLKGEAPIAALSEPAQWKAEASATISDMTSLDAAFKRLQTGPISLTDGRLSIPNFVAVVDGQAVRVNIEMLLKAPWSIDGAYEIPQLNLSHLNALPHIHELGRRLAGSVGLSGELSGTWNPLQMQATGRLRGAELRFGRYALESVQFDYDASQERAILSNLLIEGYGGQVDGSAEVNYGDLIGGSMQLNWSGIDAAEVARALAEAEIDIEGQSSGSLSLEIPAGAIESPEQWTSSAMLRIRRLNVYDWEIRQLEPIELQLQNGRFTTSRISGRLDGQPMQFSASLGVESPWPIQAEAELTQIEIEKLASLPQLNWRRGRIGGRVDVSADVQGDLDSMQLTGLGAVDASHLRFEDYLVDRISFDFEIADKSLNLTDLAASLYDGRLHGQATLPLAASAAVGGSIEWSEIELGALANSFQESTLQLQGVSSGNAEFNVPRGSWNEPAKWALQLQLNVPELRLNQILAANLEAEAKLRDGRASFQGAGSLFDGKLDFSGNALVEEIRAVIADAEGSPNLGQAQLTLRGAALSKAAVLLQGEAASPYRVDGTLSLDLTASDSPSPWSWRAELQMADLTVDGAPYAPELRAQFEGNTEAARITNLSGSVADGQLGGDGEWAFGRPQQRRFRIVLRRADVERIVGLVPSPIELPFSGAANVELNLHPGDVWRAFGTLDIGRGEAYDVGYRNARIPIAVDWAPAVGRLELRIRNSQLAIAGGRLTGQLTARKSASWTVDAAFRIFRVDTAMLFRDLGMGSRYGKGRLSGTLTVGGRNVRSLDDIRATLLADLDDAETRSIPVVGELRRFVPGAAAMGSSRFNDGRLEATLVGGIIRLQRLSLASGQLQLFLDGVITLSGRLRLEAIASTGQNANPVLAQAMLSRLVAVAVPPAGVLLAANDFLANRVIHLQIRGTVQRPIIRVKAFQTLREEAVRFFLRQATGGLAVGGAASSAR